MDRYLKFKSLFLHPWYKTQVKKLKASDLIFCENFIKENNNLDSVQFWNKLKMMRCDSIKKSDISRFNICIELLDCSRNI
jgi:mRNA-degrading endonuclease RelE of RelBE toxin-antitoxin system